MPCPNVLISPSHHTAKSTQRILSLPRFDTREAAINLRRRLKPTLLETQHPTNGTIAPSSIAGHGMSKIPHLCAAVPERASSNITPHSRINPTHSFASSFRTREAPLDLRHRQECLCY